MEHRDDLKNVSVLDQQIEAHAQTIEIFKGILSGQKDKPENETSLEEEKETLLPEQPPPPHPSAKFLIPKSTKEKEKDAIRRRTAGNSTEGLFSIWLILRFI